MKDKTQYLTHAGRAELIRAKFDNLSAKDELWLDTMLIEAFLDGWEHGVDRYKQIIESLKPDTIHFNHTIENAKTEVMRITKDGVWVNPNMEVDETAKAVLDALSSQVKVLVQKAIEDEREACAKVCDDLAANDKLSNYYVVAARAIRARGNT